MQRQRFASLMKVMVWVRVNSPYWFLDDVEASIVSTPLKSSLAFTFLGFLIWNNEKYKCKYKFYKYLEYLGIFWHFVFSKSLYYCLLLEFSVLCLILISLFPYFLIFINIYGSPRYSKMRFTCSRGSGTGLGCQVCWIFLYHFHYGFYR